VTYGLLGLAALVAAGAAFLWAAAPGEFVREQIVQQVKSRTGRDLNIAGGASVTFWPSLGLSLADVRLSAPAEVGGHPTVTMARLHVAVAPWPLLSRRVVVERLVLQEPVVDLRVDRHGRKSWELREGIAEGQRLSKLAEIAQSARKARLEAAPGAALDRSAIPSEAATGEAIASLAGLSLADVRIERGALLLSDERTGAGERLEAIDARVSLRHLNEPLRLNGSARLRGEAVNFEGLVTTPDRLLGGGPAEVMLAMTAAPLRSRFEGTLKLAPELAADGRLSIEAASVVDAMKLIGRRIAGPAALLPAAVAGRLQAGGGELMLTEARITALGATATGSVALSLADPKPQLRAGLAVSNLDVNLLTAGITAVAEASRMPREAATAPAAATSAAAGSIEDILNREEGPQPRAGRAEARGSAKREGWSEQPFRLAVLGLADIDARFNFGNLKRDRIKVDRAEATVSVKDSVLAIAFDRLELYGGRGQGQLNIDGSGERPVVSANLAVDGIAAGPFMTDVSDIKWLRGRAKLAVALSGSGISERELVQSLGGSAEFKFFDGAIVGFNVPKIWRGLGQGKLSGFDRVASESTDFSELTASFRVAGGVAENQDMSLIGPLVRASGAGVVRLGSRELDYTVRPKLVASLTGQGGETALSGLEIPVRISGPWSKPSYTPEVDTGKAVEAAKEVARQLKGKNAEEVMRALVGGTNPDGTQSSGLLGGLLGKKRGETR
jgi:AsmA protein